MAVRSPNHDDSRSPADSLPHATPTANERLGFGRSAPTEGALDLGLVRAAIQDGLLMVFGPEGDPVAPQIFGAAAAARPEAGVRLSNGPRIRAERIAAVLDAQLAHRLGSGHGGDEAWIEAMLGIGSRPEAAADDALLAEACTVDVIAFGKELMITSPTGATFLMAEARSSTPESVCLRMAGAGPIALGDLVARLLAGTSEHRTDAIAPNPNEFAVPNCKARLEDHALVIDLPKVGAVHLARSVHDAASGPSASVFMSSGETATFDDLLSALGRPLVTLAATGQAGPLDPATAPSHAGSQPPRPMPLRIGLPDALAAGPDDVALIVIRGLPGGSRLSAGVRSGDGSWFLSPRHMAGLSLTPTPGWTSDFALEVVAIAIANRDGELKLASKTVLVPVQSAVIERVVPAPIPLGLDPQALSAGGPFDAIVVRDVPARATLSAGTYDPAIHGWVLLPHQLSELSVTPASEPSQDFTLTLMGVCLQPGGRARPRILAQVPVTVS